MKYSPFMHLNSAFWKRRPIQLTLFLTSRCNARCPFCFYLSTRQPCLNGSQELTFDEIEKMAASLGNLLWLAFSGGEIFLREDIVEITKVFYELNKPAIILLPTNGLLPEKIYQKTEAILRNSPNSVVTVKLSLDGPEELHDSLRGVKGAFRQTIATYKLLCGLLDRYDNFELGINTVFCAANQDRMAEIIQFVGGRLEKIKTHTVSLIRGDVLDDELKQIDQRKYHEAIILLESRLKKKSAVRYSFKGARLKAAQDILQRRFIHQTLKHKRQVIPCYAGRLTVVVTEKGDVYPCESFAGMLGNVRESDYNLPQILQSERGGQALAAIKGKECYCTHECYMMMNILFNPCQYPVLLKEYMQVGS
jgi:radical SAM protein with 4Fe4S-binding SPASM domain